MFIFIQIHGVQVLRHRNGQRLALVKGTAKGAGVTLRISVSENPETVTIKLEGRITSTGLTEMDRTWRTVASALNSRKLRIDLRGVTFVDPVAEKSFQEIYRQTGAEFQTSSLVTRYFVDRTVHGVNNFSKDQR